MSPWNPEKMSFGEYVENIMEQVERKAAGLSYCEDPNGPGCECAACVVAEEKGISDFTIFLIDNPHIYDIIDAEEETE
jgi:hypothetical protein